MRLFAATVLILSSLLLGDSALAQQPKPKELNNVEIQSKQPGAGTLVMRFEDGILQYTFVDGPMRGGGGVNLDYTARKIGDEMYLVSWHDEVYSNHFVVVLDLKNKVDYTDTIMFYGTDAQNVFWADGVIEKVTSIE